MEFAVLPPIPLPITESAFPRLSLAFTYKHYLKQFKWRQKHNIKHVPWLWFYWWWWSDGCTSIVSHPSILLTNFAEVVFPIPGFPLIKTAFFSEELLCFFPFPLLCKNCSFQFDNQSWRPLTCSKQQHRLNVFSKIYRKKKNTRNNNCPDQQGHTIVWLPIISFGTLGLYFSVHVEEAPSFERSFFLAGEGCAEDLGALLAEKLPPSASVTTGSPRSTRKNWKI